MNDLTIAEPIAADAIRSRILTIRGVQAMLDRDLAELTTVGQSLSTAGRVPQPFHDPIVYWSGADPNARKSQGRHPPR